MKKMTLAVLLTFAGFFAFADDINGAAQEQGVQAQGQTNNNPAAVWPFN